MKTRCERGVHKFEPRYEKLAPKWFDQLESFKGFNPLEAYEKHYICDVCVRCGKTNRRPMPYA